jgi:hypothetical protein
MESPRFHPEPSDISNGLTDIPSFEEPEVSNTLGLIDNEVTLDKLARNIELEK